MPLEKPNAVTRSASRSTPWLHVSLLAFCASLAACLVTLDQPVYRVRTDASSDRSDVRADRTTVDGTGDIGDVRDAAPHDGNDLVERDITPPDDVNVANDGETEAGLEDATVSSDGAITDVEEIEASFEDGAVDAIVTDVPMVTCPTCPFGQTCCGGVCVNTSINELHCGACGLVCPRGTVCQSGRCGNCTLGLLCGADQRCCIGGLLCVGILCP